MSVEKPVFIPGPNCVDPDVCKVLKDCQEARVIEGEIRYESEKRGSSRLAHQLAISKCQHERAREARRAGNNVLSG